MTNVQTMIPLKDGPSLYNFKDGKLGMEDKFGRPQSMKQGHVMETKDGKKIIMTGNEVWRVEELVCAGRPNGHHRWPETQPALRGAVDVLAFGRWRVDWR